MASVSPSVPVKKPKLRCSCDACGAAKLKCDRGQPECQRCISRGVTCIYGVSRKMGKPPRDRSRHSWATPQTFNDRAGGRNDMDGMGTANSSNSSDCGNGGSGIMLDLTSFLNIPDDTAGGPPSPSSRDIADEHGIDRPLDFSSLDFSEWAVTDDCIDSLLNTNPRFGPTATPGHTISAPHSLTDLEAYSSSTRSASRSNSESQYRPDDRSSSHHRSASTVPSTPPSSRDHHDCLQEAYEILGSLSCVNLSKSLSADAASATTGGVPLDRVLQLNRAACKRLGRLLACSCACSPNLALLYASSIARILVWYQQAACTPSPVPPPSWDSAAGAAAAAAAIPITPETTTWPSPATSGGSGAGEIAVAPANMAIGTFNVDDLRVQSALKIQLLFGEMRIAARLVDQFVASHSLGGQRLGDKSSFGGVESLYQSLDSWLRVEHSRIADMMRSKLRELNA